MWIWFIFQSASSRRSKGICSIENITRFVVSVMVSTNDAFFFQKVTFHGLLTGFGIVERVKGQVNVIDNEFPSMLQMADQFFMFLLAGIITVWRYVLNAMTDTCHQVTDFMMNCTAAVSNLADMVVPSLNAVACSSPSFASWIRETADLFFLRKSRSSVSLE